MHSPPRILIVDDNDTNRDILNARLSVHGYELFQAADGEQAIAATKEHLPDLILLDVMMPRLDGIEVCRRLRADTALPFTPIILVTAKAESEDIVAGLEAGADEYLTKPVDQVALVARVKSVLRMKSLHDQVQAQARDLAAWNHTLEQRVADQVAELEQLGRLKRFLSPQVAELVVSSGKESLLNSHRQQIAALFCDLRGFSRFSETSEPEDVISVLQAYHEAMGRLIHGNQGTLEHRAGDGIMVIFNDPLPCDNPAVRAIETAVAMRERMRELAADWRKLGHDLGFGVGIALGYATMGMVGFEGRFDYCANGSIVNLAARLADEATDGQILISQRVCTAVEDRIETEPMGELSLKGFHKPVMAFNVLRTGRSDDRAGVQAE